MAKLVLGLYFIFGVERSQGKGRHRPLLKAWLWEDCIGIPPLEVFEEIWYCVLLD
jgi:hypothetical protein